MMAYAPWPRPKTAKVFWGSQKASQNLNAFKLLGPAAHRTWTAVAGDCVSFRPSLCAGCLEDRIGVGEPDQIFLLQAGEYMPDGGSAVWRPQPTARRMSTRRAFSRAKSPP